MDAYSQLGMLVSMRNVRSKRLAIYIPQSDSRQLSKMSLAFTIYHFAFQGVQALPIATSSRVVEPSHSAPSVRTKFSIIFSCLSTIFLCTWVAAHPNIPGPGFTRQTVFWHHVRLVAVAIIAPEAVIMWAARQWIAARELRDKYEGMFVFCLNLTILTNLPYEIMGGHLLTAILPSWGVLRK